MLADDRAEGSAKYCEINTHLCGRPLAFPSTLKYGARGARLDVLLPIPEMGVYFAKTKVLLIINT